MTTKYKSRMLFGILLVVASTLSGCSEQDCTAAACLNGVDITFATPLEIEDTAEILVESGDRKWKCTIDAEESCPAESGLRVSRDQEGRIANIFVASTGSVSLEIHDGEQLISEATFTPDYKTIYPNGPECGGECSYATYTVR